MAKVLIVEDDANFAEVLITSLRKEKHVVDHALSVTDGRGFIRTYQYDVFVLDWDLPDGSGATLCSDLIAAGTTIPIIMLTARSALESRVHGLDCGATDYVCKPCYPEELSARIRAVLRRKGLAGEVDLLSCGGLSVNATARTIQYLGETLQLSPTEFDIVHALLEHPRPLTGDNIVRLVTRGIDSRISRSSLKVYISAMRKKFTACGADVQIISTPEGYMLAVDQTKK